jgi:hypothetical protein
MVFFRTPPNTPRVHSHKFRVRFHRKLTQRIIVEEIVMGLFMVFPCRSFPATLTIRNAAAGWFPCKERCLTTLLITIVGDIFLRNTATFLAVFADARTTRSQQYPCMMDIPFDEQQQQIIPNAHDQQSQQQHISCSGCFKPGLLLSPNYNASSCPLRFRRHDSHDTSHFHVFGRVLHESFTGGTHRDPLRRVCTV